MYGVHIKNNSSKDNHLKKLINADKPKISSVDNSEILNDKNSDISTKKTKNKFELTPHIEIGSDDPNPNAESESFMLTPFNENKTIPKNSNPVKSERHSLDIDQIFVCPICKSEGIFRNSYKAQQHISEFHQIQFGIVPQIRTLFWYLGNSKQELFLSIMLMPIYYNYFENEKFIVCIVNQTFGKKNFFLWQMHSINLAHNWVFLTQDLLLAIAQ